MSTVWRSSPLSEEELSELPECVLCERLVRRAERGVRSGARVPSLRVSRVTLSGAASTARVERGLGPKGDGGESAAGFVPPSLQEMQGIGRQVSYEGSMKGPPGVLPGVWCGGQFT